MATIYDVAKAAGVSPKTVSRVLNSDAPVKQETRAAVEAAMAALGYLPSNAARMMRSNKSGLIGLITGALTHTIEEPEAKGLPDLFIVQGVQKAIAASGKTLMIADTGGRPDGVAYLARTFMQHRVEGLIYVAEHHQEVSFSNIAAGCPMVLANCFDEAGLPAIVPDDRTCQRLLVEKIIQSGHRRIGFLTLDRNMVATGLRYKGYRDALHDAGLSYDDALVSMGYEAGVEQESHLLMASLERLLGLREPPTVICCGNDEMALRVYGMVRSRGLRIPEDISIAGFDDYRVIAETLYPPLTTVELPYFAMGQAAAETLLSLIAGAEHAPAPSRKIDGPVLWRSSVTALNSVSILNPKGRTNP